MTKINRSRHQKKIYGCDKCYDKGYILQKQKKYSIASLCECYLCEECSNTGKIQFYNDIGYSFIKPCDDCGLLHKNIKLYNISCIPAKYYDKYQVDTFQPNRHDTHKEALKYVKDFVDLYPHKKGFILMGPAGLGKTHLAVGAISELTLERGVHCIFKEFFDLLNELKKAYTEGTSESNVILPLVDTEVLVIDELGKGRANEWELSVLDQLISNRYNSSKITLITTNYIDSDTNQRLNKESKEILEFRVGERIASRLYEMCNFIYLEGRDFRKLSMH
jgi:DNA replication protein DnaC